MRMNRQLVAGEDGVTRAEVEAEADALDGRMHIAPTLAARRVGASPGGGRVRAGAAPPAGAAGGVQLAFLLGSLVEAVRSGVEAFRQVVRMLPACVAPTNDFRRTVWLLLCGAMRPRRWTRRTRMRMTSRLRPACVGWLVGRVGGRLRACLLCAPPLRLAGGWLVLSFLLSC